MDKQKINLDQIYQERFQSFEMEQSSDISARMQKKLKYAKTMTKVKWILIGFLITATAVSITLLSIHSDKNENKPNHIEKEIIPNQKTESPNNIKATNNNPEKTKKKPVELNQTRESIEQAAEKPEKQSLVKTEVISKEAESNLLSETEGIAVHNVTGTDEETAIVKELAKTNRAESRNTEVPEWLDSRYILLEIPPDKNSIDKNSLKLTPQKRLGASKAGFNGGKTPILSNDISIPNERGNASKLDGYFDLHFAPLLWQNNADLVIPDLDSTWTSSLNHSAKLSYEFGLSFQLHHQDIPLFLQLGMDYQVLKEKVDYQFNRYFQDPDLSYWTFDSIWDYQDVLDTFYIIVDSNQFVIDSIFTIDTVLSNVDSLFNPVMSSEERSKKNINTYRYLNIPLLLGYQFQSRNKKWNYQVLAGAAIAINLKNEGYYYTNSGEFETYSGKVSPSMVWNFYAAANINYRWRKWQLFAQPEFQYQLNESELNHQIPRRKYLFYKMKFGIRYKLF